MLRWTGFIRVFLVAIVAGVASASALSLLSDPYWAFRSDPPWLRGSYATNRLLDTDGRLAKPLQFILRPPPETVLLGSSVMYRGLDPSTLPISRTPAYNFGLSALMAYELPTLARLIVSRPSPRTIVIGLDYFSFTRFPLAAPLSPDLDTPGGRALFVTNRVLSWRSLSGIGIAFGGETYEPGGWALNGFRQTPDRDARLTAQDDGRQLDNLLPFEPTALVGLDEALSILRDRHVVLYLSPLSNAQRRIFAAKGLEGDLDRWRSAVAASAATHGVPFHDLTDDRQFDDFDPQVGSSPSWFDNLHFKPAVGQWVVDAIDVAGLDAR
ncbi:hypothetical protein [Microvirga antarctica]|uniref:hypothetical protein n=1 Tax=Microvirga antarctica TaxID=2819233 RepID=UPI001B313190|nr:hypothetical protein [Microvirga antarctica]